MNAKRPWRCRVERLARLAFWALLTGGPAARAEAPANALEPLVVGIVLNAINVSDAQTLYRDAAAASPRYWLPLALAHNWRIDIERRSRQTIEGSAHTAICGELDRCTFDEAGSILTLTVADPDLLPLRFEPGPPSLATPEPVRQLGAVLNYDLSAWRAERPGVAAFADARLHSPWGHGALRTAALASGANARLAALQAVWQVDDPARRLSAQVGSITVPGTSFSAGLPLTGLRIGTNSRFTEVLAQSLLPVVTGSAARQQTTDVFVDGLYRQTAAVAYGPYRIALAPPLPGRGDIELVTTDIAGAQERRTLAYYIAPRALADGAEEWSVDAGALSADLRPRWDRRLLVGSAAWRRGLGSNWTGDVQWLGARALQRLALGADRVDARLGLSRADLTLQVAQGRAQSWLGAGHEFLSRSVSVTVHTESALHRCRQEPSQETLAAQLDRPCSRVNTALRAQASERLSGALVWDAQRGTGTLPNASALSLSARWVAGPQSELAVGVQRVRLPGRHAVTIGLTWSQSLGNQVAQVGFQQRDGARSEAAWSVQSTPAATDQGTDRRWQVFGSAGARNEFSARMSERTAMPNGGPKRGLARTAPPVRSA